MAAASRETCSSASDTTDSCPSASLLSSLSHALQNSRAASPAGGYRGSVRLHTLFSIPRLARGLYSHAHVQAYGLPQGQPCTTTTAVDAYVEHVVVTASYEPESEETGAAERQQSREGTLVYALECFLYTLPAHRSAILYVSKLDTTGWIPAPPHASLRPFLPQDPRVPVPSGSASLKYTSTSITQVLTSAFLEHFASFRHWNIREGNGTSGLLVSSSSSSSSTTTTTTRTTTTTASQGRGNAPVGHLAIHVLARAQPAYLFPGSPDHKGKRVLGDAGLVKWWRALLSGVIARMRMDDKECIEDQDTRPKAYYLMPGYSRLESHVVVPLPPPSTYSTAPTSAGRPPDTVSRTLAEARWTYGHPYSDVTVPLPLHWEETASASSATQRSIATLIPHFPDDPKARFLDELVRDAHEAAAGRGALRSSSSAVAATVTDIESTSAPSDAARMKDDDVGGGQERNAKRSCLESPTLADDGLIPVNMSAGTLGSHQSTSAAVASASGGDPVVADSSTSVATRTAQVQIQQQQQQQQQQAQPPSKARPLTKAARALQRERAALDAVSADEFWERMGFRQECCAGNVVGVFVLLFTQRAAGSAEKQTDPTMLSSGAGPNPGPKGPSPNPTPSSGLAPAAQPLSLPHPTIPDLLLRQLMRDANDWSDPSTARELTGAWNDAVRRALLRKGGLGQMTLASTSDHASCSGSGDGAQLREGKGEKEANQPQVQSRNKSVGQGLIWADVHLAGPTRAQLADAEEQLRAKRLEHGLDPDMETGTGTNGGTSSSDSARGAGAGAGAGSDSHTAVNTLTVKRKRKAQ